MTGVETAMGTVGVTSAAQSIWKVKVSMAYPLKE
jgi:hypothetical protein